ncbi:hypothetical protein DMC30DRAFT_90463 [Rhodotorula diobovata]|uniref:KRR1 small subunit processome component n=1 Tax=Rhodotorula diobovata TaxID=5288 RepID=A0A5C5FM67_9BASI|nr:hypothetical protein DMC30DRAFT_90463 [Rhodotorula diobovata]
MARKNAAQKKAAEEARQKLAQENPEEAARLDEERAAKSKKQMHRKDKPWDVEGTDHWSIEPFQEGDMKGALLEESSFATLFAKYRETYLREIWGHVEAALKKHGIEAVLDLVEGSMTVKTTRKTYDPYIILKARDLIKLLARSVPFPQAVKILEDGMDCDIIKIGNIIRNNERFVKRRQRILGPGGSTLKAIELLTQCYVLVQGNTVAAMGGHKGLKEVRKIVVDCMKNVHPIYHIKELMIKRELAKDPKLATENWDRFLPKFRRRREKKRGSGSGAGAGAEGASGANAVPVEGGVPGAAPAQEASGQPPAKKQKKEKKPYTPFPPAQMPSKIDLQLESGEYFLKPREKQQRDEARRAAKQAQVVAGRKDERAQAFVAPEEGPARAVVGSVGDAVKKDKKKRKREE